MKLEEARKYAENVSLHLQAHSGCSYYIPSQKDEALICLAAKVTELEAQRDELVEALIDTMKECEHPFLDDITLVEKVTGKLWEEIK